MSIRRRLENLEARTPPPAPVRPGSVTLDEIRALEEHIRRLEALTQWIAGPKHPEWLFYGILAGVPIVAFLGLTRRRR